jgi:hypothetical protein
MARVMREGTETATGMSAQQRIVTTNLGTLTVPTSRNLKALCPRRSGPGESLDVLGGLSSLVDASLLRREMDDEPRLRMLAVIRENARELLVESGEADTTRRPCRNRA